VHISFFYAYVIVSQQNSANRLEQMGEHWRVVFWT